MSSDEKISFEGLDKPTRSPRYSAFILNKVGNIVGMVKLTAEDDPTALSQAQALVDGHAVELWDGVRFIEHFPAVD